MRMVCRAHATSSSSVVRKALARSRVNRCGNRNASPSTSAMDSRTQNVSLVEDQFVGSHDHDAPRGLCPVTSGTLSGRSERTASRQDTGVQNSVEQEESGGKPDL